MTDVARKEKAVTARRERTVFSQAQLDELESYFKRDKYLDYENKYHLGKKLNLSDAKIQIWFKNRRAKLKREMRERMGGFVSPPFCHPNHYQQFDHPEHHQQQQYHPNHHPNAYCFDTSPRIPLDPQHSHDHAEICYHHNADAQTLRGSGHRSVSPAKITYLPPIKLIIPPNNEYSMEGYQRHIQETNISEVNFAPQQVTDQSISRSDDDNEEGSNNRSPSISSRNNHLHHHPQNPSALKRTTILRDWDTVRYCQTYNKPEVQYFDEGKIMMTDCPNRCCLNPLCANTSRKNSQEIDREYS